MGTASVAIAALDSYFHVSNFYAGLEVFSLWFFGAGLLYDKWSFKTPWGSAEGVTGAETRSALEAAVSASPIEPLPSISGSAPSAKVLEGSVGFSGRLTIKRADETDGVRFELPALSGNAELALPGEAAPEEMELATDVPAVSNFAVLRIGIERELRKIARLARLDPPPRHGRDGRITFASAGQLLRRLGEHEILDGEFSRSLTDVIAVANRALHGSAEDAANREMLALGPQLIDGLAAVARSLPSLAEIVRVRAEQQAGFQMVDRTDEFVDILVGNALIRVVSVYTNAPEPANPRTVYVLAANAKLGTALVRALAASAGLAAVVVDRAGESFIGNAAAASAADWLVDIIASQDEVDGVS